MAQRAFPVIYTSDVGRSVAFYTSLGFETTFQFPPEGEPGYVSLARGESSLGIVSRDHPKGVIDIEMGDGARFEMFVYVDDVDASIDELGVARVPVLRAP